MVTQKNNQVLPPIRLETLQDYARKIFEPIKRGENVTTVWLPMSGRRIRNKFIISYPKFFQKEIGDIHKYLFVYVEPLELTEESNIGYIKLLIHSIIESYSHQINKNSGKSLREEYSLDESSPTYPRLLEKLKELVENITHQNLEIIIFLDEFDELEFAGSVLYNNLKSLWTKFEGQLHFVFLLLEDVTTPEAISKSGELNALLLQNVICIPLGDKTDTHYLIDYFGQQLEKQFSEEEKGLLVEICGGHPYLIKSCSRLIALMNGKKLTISDLKKTLLAHFEPRSVCQKIFDLRNPLEKTFLKRLVAGGKTKELPPEAETLAKLGLITKGKEDIWTTFGDLFNSVIAKGEEGPKNPQATGTKLAFDEQSGAILINGNNFEERFTRQEYEVLQFFLKDPNKLRSRDEIGEAMWGKESYDKYSDWAIDQLTSKLRRKLKNLGAGEILITIKGRGYKLALS